MTTTSDLGTIGSGDTFLCLTTCGSRGEAGEVGTVAAPHAFGWWINAGDRRGFVAEESELLDPTEFQRVPAGYVLPTSLEWHAATRRLIEAYRASLADPETGLRGAHECMQRMATMAGMDVPT